MLLAWVCGACAPLGEGDTRDAHLAGDAGGVFPSMFREADPRPAGPLVTVPTGCGTRFCRSALPGPASMVAVGDIDGDGFPDLLLGSTGPMLGDVGALTLLRNERGAGFVDVTAWAGLAGLGAWSAIFGDLDNDGDQDVVLGARVGSLDGTREEAEERVLLNDGRGRYEPLALPPRPEGSRGTPGAILSVELTDLDGDGLLDIVSGRSGTDRAGSYLPRVLLARPRLRYVDASELFNHDGFNWNVIATDLDDDGRADMLFTQDANATLQAQPVARETGPCAFGGAFAPQGGWLNAAYRSVPDGALRMQPVDLGDPFHSTRFTPMGVGVGDFDGDGALDYLMTSGGSPELFVGARGGLPRHSPHVAGIWFPRTSDGSPSMSWSALARDIDNDGLVDALVTYGVIPIGRDDESNTIYFNRGPQRFWSVPFGEGFDAPGSWSALASGDFDNDGDDDFVLGAQTVYLRPCDATPAHGFLLRNQAEREGRHWLRVRLRGTVANRDGLGARIEADVSGRTLVREVSRSGGTEATSDGDTHLGLNDARAVSRLRVRWPDGYVQELRDVAADRVVTVDEPRWFTVTRGTRGPAEVRLALASLSGVSLSLEGAARWTSHLRQTAPGVWARAFSGTGEVTVHVATSGSAADAVRRVRFP